MAIIILRLFNHIFGLEFETCLKRFSRSLSCLFFIFIEPFNFFLQFFIFFFKFYNFCPVRIPDIVY